MTGSWRISRNFAISFVLLASLCTAAERVEWLYSVERPVPDRSASSVASAIADGLNIQLTRISGMQVLPSTPGLRRAISESDRYVRQYSFRSDLTGSDPAASVLIVEFEPSAVLELLRNENLPIWRAERPRVLVWYEFSTSNGSQMLFDSDILSEPWKRTASDRGLPLLLPLMDLEDRNLVTNASVSGGFEQDCLQASARYNAELIALVRSKPLQFERQRIFVDLWVDGIRREELSFDTDSRETVAEVVVDRIADILAEQFAIASDQSRVIRIAVRGINSIHAFKSVMSHIGRYELIDQVEVAYVTSELLELKIATPMSQQQLSALLSNSDGSRLVVDVGRRAANQSLAFTWVDN